MAVRGYCLAKIDVSVSTNGGMLVKNGATTAGSFATKDSQTENLAYPVVSHDCGVLLAEPSADGLRKVWLY